MSALAGTQAETAYHRERYLLGFAGLAPFVAGVAVMAFAGDPDVVEVATRSLSAYAAIIVSFLGAVHWGIAAETDDTTRRARLRWGVTPALVAWVLLMLPAAAALAGFALLFAMVLAVDRYLLPALDVAYRRLRLQLSLVVVTLLAGAAVMAAARTT